MLSPLPVKVRCRQITRLDLAAVVGLLCAGFPRRKPAYWQAGLDRMGAREIPEHGPQFGYCLEVSGALVGVILLIASERWVDGTRATFTNLASWYVRPEYRPFAHQLAAMALKDRATSYTNVTAAPATWPVVEKQGYRKYCNGLFFAVAALSKPQPSVKIHDFASLSTRPDVQAMADFPLLQRHANWGCSVIVAEEAGQLSGFIFRRFAMRSGMLKLPAMFVVHAPSQNDVIRLAGNLGRHFMKAAAPFLVMDANGPIENLRGLYTERRGRKFAKGPHQPKLCDLADTEFAIFDI